MHVNGITSEVDQKAVKKKKKKRKKQHPQEPIMFVSLTASFELDCKTVGFFLNISKKIGKGWRKSLTRATRDSLTRP